VRNTKEDDAGLKWWSASSSFAGNGKNQLIAFWYDLDPVTVRICDEVDSHTRVFKTDTAHLFVTFIETVEIIGYESKVKFAFSQIIWFGAITKPGQFECKIGGVITHIYELEGIIRCRLFSGNMKIKSFFIEFDTFFQIQNIEVKVVELNHSRFLLVIMFHVKHLGKY
jgi:hypothetical protein